MKVLSLDPDKNRNPDALQGFLERCKGLAKASGRPVLASITLEVDALDPLAVLESIFEPKERHFYVERPSDRMALAGAEAAFTFTASGPDRFRACQAFIDQISADAVAVGPLDAPFAGPHFFFAATFEDYAFPDQPFLPASVFVPRWQVGHRGGRTTAVANLAIDGSTALRPLVDRVWKAHRTFQSFDYRKPHFDEETRRTRVRTRLPRSDYLKAIRKAIRLIQDGDCRKIVLARSKLLRSTTPFHPLQALNDLRQRFPDCYAFSVANGLGHSFIGASPELLLRVADGTLETEALAGSISRGPTASEDASYGRHLLNDEKERFEHRLVVESIARSLTNLGIPLPPLPAPSLRRLANVQHLHTPIRTQVPKDIRFLAIVSELQPTPAVGGEPRDAAIKAIKALERGPRGLYSGTLGWLDAQGRGECFVGLRSATVDGRKAFLHAGAGIVRDSNPYREFAETELKFRAMQEALGYSSRPTRR